MLTGKGGGSGGRAKSYDRRKNAWSSINHSILSGCGDPYPNSVLEHSGPKRKSWEHISSTRELKDKHEYKVLGVFLYLLYASVLTGSVSLHKSRQGAYRYTSTDRGHIKRKMIVKKLGGNTQPIITDERLQGAYGIWYMVYGIWYMVHWLCREGAPRYWIFGSACNIKTDGPIFFPKCWYWFFAI